jgi:hypothetical protein
MRQCLNPLLHAKQHNLLVPSLVARTVSIGEDAAGSATFDRVYDIARSTMSQINALMCERALTMSDDEQYTEAMAHATVMCRDLMMMIMGMHAKHMAALGTLHIMEKCSKQNRAPDDADAQLLEKIMHTVGLIPLSGAFKALESVAENMDEAGVGDLVNKTLDRAAEKMKEEQRAGQSNV